ncbi:hypothetical protein HDV00_012789, partial [Rhizophlyctis rosea]
RATEGNWDRRRSTLHPFFPDLLDTETDESNPVGAVDFLDDSRANVAGLDVTDVLVSELVQAKERADVAIRLILDSWYRGGSSTPTGTTTPDELTTPDRNMGWTFGLDVHAHAERQRTRTVLPEVGFEARSGEIVGRVIGGGGDVRSKRQSFGVGMFRVGGGEGKERVVAPVRVKHQKGRQRPFLMHSKSWPPSIFASTHDVLLSRIESLALLILHTPSQHLVSHTSIAVDIMRQLRELMEQQRRLVNQYDHSIQTAAHGSQDLSKIPPEAPTHTPDPIPHVLPDPVHAEPTSFTPTSPPSNQLSPPLAPEWDRPSQETQLITAYDRRIVSTPDVDSEVDSVGPPGIGRDAYGGRRSMGSFSSYSSAGVITPGETPTTSSIRSPRGSWWGQRKGSSKPDLPTATSDAVSAKESTSPPQQQKPPTSSPKPARKKPVMSFLKTLRQAFTTSPTPSSTRSSPTLSIDSFGSSVPSTPSTTTHPTASISDQDLAGKSRLSSSSYDRVAFSSAPVLPSARIGEGTKGEREVLAEMRIAGLGGKEKENETRTRSHSHAPSTASSGGVFMSRGATGAEEIEMMVCRICEIAYPAVEMEQHSTVCAIQQEFHLR